MFTLETVDGQPLPETLTATTAVDGTRYELQAIRGLITLDDGKLHKELDARNLWNGVPTDTIRGKWVGTYSRTDSTVVIQFYDGGVYCLIHSARWGPSPPRG